MSALAEDYGSPVSLTSLWALDPSSIEALLAKPGVAQPQAAGNVVRRGSVAVVEIIGPLATREGPWSRWLGAVPLDRLARDLEAVVADAQTSAVIMTIDSPGGELAGVSEMAGLMSSASVRKSVIAYVGGMAASGAYWLASAASHVVVNQTAMLGALGVASTLTERDPQDGTKAYRFVSSQSPNKRPDPETDAGRAQLQRLVDRLAAEFVAGVADLRGVSERHVVERFGRGGLVVGSDAVAAGMADSIGTLEETIARLAGGWRPAPGAVSGRAATSREASSMPQALHATTLPSGDDIEASCRAAWDRDPAIRAEFRTLERHVAYERSMARHRSTPAVARASAGEAARDCQAAWDRDPAIRAEFRTLERFIAFETAERAGRARMSRCHRAA